MKKHLVGLTVLCATCLVLAAQAQSHSGGTLNDSSTVQDSSAKPSTWDRIKNLAATGRTHQDIRASQLTSAEVKSSSGDTIGTISDMVINPTSGKIDFAVLSLNGSSSFSSSSETGTSSSGRTGTTSPASATSSSTAGGTKQVAVPWTLLQSANSSSTTSSAMAQQTFTYSGDMSKLHSAPAFDPNTDMSQPGWFQSIFSYFGVNQNSATGGATSPGSSSSGSSSGNRSYPDGNPSNNP